MWNRLTGKAEDKASHKTTRRKAQSSTRRRSDSTLSASSKSQPGHERGDDVSNRVARPVHWRQERSSSRDRKDECRSYSRDKQWKEKGKGKEREERRTSHDRTEGLGHGMRPELVTGRGLRQNGDRPKHGDRSFSEQFPGHDTQPVTSTHLSQSPGNFSSHINDQFPGQDPAQYSAPFRPPSAFAPPSGYGEAASYYGDQGQSISSQPGIRPEKPTVVAGAQTHLTTPSEATGNGSVAEFYVSGQTAQANQTMAYPISPNKPPASQAPIYSNASGKASTPSALVGGAALGYAVAASSSNPSNPIAAFGETDGTGKPNRPNHMLHTYNSAPSPSPASVPGKQRFDSNFTYSAAGPAPANHGHYHASNQQASSLGLATMNAHTYEGAASSHGQGTIALEDRPRLHGPFSKFLEWWKDYEDVQKMEEYTEYIGVCRGCFDPRTSVWEAPRKHMRRRRSSDSLQSNRRRVGSSKRVDSRIDKERRYNSSDTESRRRRNKYYGAGAGIAGYALAESSHALWEQNNKPQSTGKVSAQELDASPERRSSRSPLLEKAGSRTRPYGIDQPGQSSGVNGRAPVARSPARHENPGELRSTERRIVGRKQRSRSRSPIRGSRPALTDATWGANVHPRLPYPNVPSPKKDRSPNNRFFAGWFGSSSDQKRDAVSRKKKGFFFLANASSSSSEGLAYGSGSESRRSPRSVKEKSDGDLNAALWGLGAAAAALAASGHPKVRNQRRPPDLIAVKEPRHRRQSRRSRQKLKSDSDNDDDGWESASDPESSTSADSGLAFGDYDYRRSGLASKSTESLHSESSGTSKWGWRWGNKKTRKKSSGPDFGAHAKSFLTDASANDTGLKPSNAPATLHGDGRVSESNLPLLQHIDPMPISETQSVDYSSPTINQSTSAPNIVSSRPGPVPLQQPQPIAPISPGIYTTQIHDQQIYSAPTGPPVFSTAQRNSGDAVPRPQTRKNVSEIRSRANPEDEPLGAGKLPNRGYSSPSMSVFVKDTDSGRPEAGADIGTVSQAPSRTDVVSPSVRFDLTKDQHARERREKEADWKETEQATVAHGEIDDTERRNRERRERRRLERRQRDCLEEEAAEQPKVDTRTEENYQREDLLDRRQYDQSERHDRTRIAKSSSDAGKTSVPLDQRSEGVQPSNRDHDDDHGVYAAREYRRSKETQARTSDIASMTSSEMVEDLRNRYNEEAPSMAAFFAPPDLAPDSTKEPSDLHGPNADYDLQVYTGPRMRIDAGRHSYSTGSVPSATSAVVDSAHAISWAVPQLTLQAPTPPPDSSKMPSHLQRRPPSPLATSVAVPQPGPEQIDAKQPVSFGKDHARGPYDDGAQSVRISRAGSAEFRDAERQDVELAKYSDEASQESMVEPPHMPGSFEDDVEKVLHERNDEVVAAAQRQGFYQSPYYETVSDLGSGPELTTIEFAGSEGMTVEGTTEETLPSAEGTPHREEDDFQPKLSKKERKKGAKLAKGQTTSGNSTSEPDVAIETNSTMETSENPAPTMDASARQRGSKQKHKASMQKPRQGRANDAFDNDAAPAPTSQIIADTKSPSKVNRTLLARTKEGREEPQHNGKGRISPGQSTFSEFAEDITPCSATDAAEVQVRQSNEGGSTLHEASTAAVDTDQDEERNRSLPGGFDAAELDPREHGDDSEYNEMERRNIPSSAVSDPEDRWQSKQAKKKSKRRSGRYSSPLPGSPLRSELSHDYDVDSTGGMGQEPSREESDGGGRDSNKPGDEARSSMTEGIVKNDNDIQAASSDSEQPRSDTGRQTGRRATPPRLESETGDQNPDSETYKQQSSGDIGGMRPSLKDLDEQDVPGHYQSERPKKGKTKKGGLLGMFTSLQSSNDASDTRELQDTEHKQAGDSNAKRRSFKGRSGEEKLGSGLKPLLEPRDSDQSSELPQEQRGDNALSNRSTSKDELPDDVTDRRDEKSFLDKGAEEDFPPLPDTTSTPPNLQPVETGLSSEVIPITLPMHPAFRPADTLPSAAATVTVGSALAFVGSPFSSHVYDVDVAELPPSSKSAPTAPSPFEGSVPVYPQLLPAARPPSPVDAAGTTHIPSFAVADYPSSIDDETSTDVLAHPSTRPTSPPDDFIRADEFPPLPATRPSTPTLLGRLEDLPSLPPTRPSSPIEAEPAIDLLSVPSTTHSSPADSRRAVDSPHFSEPGLSPPIEVGPAVDLPNLPSTRPSSPIEFGHTADMPALPASRPSSPIDLRRVVDHPALPSTIAPSPVELSHIADLPPLPATRPSSPIDDGRVLDLPPLPDSKPSSPVETGQAMGSPTLSPAGRAGPSRIWPLLSMPSSQFYTDSEPFLPTLGHRKNKSEDARQTSAPVKPLTIKQSSEHELRASLLPAAAETFPDVSSSQLAPDSDSYFSMSHNQASSKNAHLENLPSAQSLTANTAFIPSHRPGSPYTLEELASTLPVREYSPVVTPPPRSGSISNTAVPLRFRLPSSPGVARDSPLSSPLAHTPSSPLAMSRTRHSRPNSTEFKCNEFRPLYLLERNRKTPQVEETLPPLPLSQTTSRSSSVQASDEDYQSALESPGPDSDGEDNEWIASGHRDDFLDSQQPTPKAATIPEEALPVVPDLTPLDHVDETLTNVSSSPRDTRPGPPERFHTAADPSPLHPSRTSTEDSEPSDHFDYVDRSTSSNSKDLGLLSTLEKSISSILLGSSPVGMTKDEGSSNDHRSSNLSNGSMEVSQANENNGLTDIVDHPARELADLNVGEAADLPSAERPDSLQTSAEKPGAHNDRETLGEPLDRSAVPARATPEEELERQTQDAQDAVDSWFGAPTLFGFKRAKKNKKSKDHSASRPSSSSRYAPKLPESATSAVHEATSKGALDFSVSPNVQFPGMILGIPDVLTMRLTQSSNGGPEELPQNQSLPKVDNETRLGVPSEQEATTQALGLVAEAVGLPAAAADIAASARHVLDNANEEWPKYSKKVKKGKGPKKSSGRGKVSVLEDGNELLEDTTIGGQATTASGVMPPEHTLHEPPEPAHSVRYLGSPEEPLKASSITAGPALEQERGSEYTFTTAKSKGKKGKKQKKQYSEFESAAEARETLIGSPNTPFSPSEPVGSVALPPPARLEAHPEVPTKVVESDDIIDEDVKGLKPQPVDNADRDADFVKDRVIESNPSARADNRMEMPDPIKSRDVDERVPQPTEAFEERSSEDMNVHVLPIEGTLDNEPAFTISKKKGKRKGKNKQTVDIWGGPEGETSASERERPDDGARNGDDQTQPLGDTPFVEHVEVVSAATQPGKSAGSKKKDKGKKIQANNVWATPISVSEAAEAGAHDAVAESQLDVSPNRKKSKKGKGSRAWEDNSEPLFELPAPSSANEQEPSCEEFAKQVPLPSDEDGLGLSIDEIAEKVPLPTEEDDEWLSYQVAQKVPLPTDEDNQRLSLDQVAEKVPLPSNEDEQRLLLDDTAQNVPLPSDKDESQGLEEGTESELLTRDSTAFATAMNPKEDAQPQDQTTSITKQNRKTSVPYVAGPVNSGHTSAHPSNQHESQVAASKELPSEARLSIKTEVPQDSKSEAPVASNPEAIPLPEAGPEEIDGLLESGALRPAMIPLPEAGSEEIDGVLESDAPRPATIPLPEAGLDEIDDLLDRSGRSSFARSDSSTGASVHLKSSTPSSEVPDAQSATEIHELSYVDVQEEQRSISRAVGGTLSEMGRQAIAEDEVDSDGVVAHPISEGNSNSKRREASTINPRPELSRYTTAVEQIESAGGRQQEPGTSVEPSASLSQAADEDWAITSTKKKGKKAKKGTTLPQTPPSVSRHMPMEQNTKVHDSAETPFEPKQQPDSLISSKREENELSGLDPDDVESTPFKSAQSVSNQTMEDKSPGDVRQVLLKGKGKKEKKGAKQKQIMPWDNDEAMTQNHDSTEVTAETEAFTRTQAELLGQRPASIEDNEWQTESRSKKGKKTKKGKQRSMPNQETHSTVSGSLPAGADSIAGVRLDSTETALPEGPPNAEKPTALPPMDTKLPAVITTDETPKEGDSANEEVKQSASAAGIASEAKAESSKHDDDDVGRLQMQRLQHLQADNDPSVVLPGESKERPQRTADTGVEEAGKDDVTRPPTSKGIVDRAVDFNDPLSSENASAESDDVTYSAQPSWQNTQLADIPLPDDEPVRPADVGKPEEDEAAEELAQIANIPLPEEHKPIQPADIPLPQNKEPVQPADIPLPEDDEKLQPAEIPLLKEDAIIKPADIPLPDNDGLLDPVASSDSFAQSSTDSYAGQEVDEPKGLEVTRGDDEAASSVAEAIRLPAPAAELAASKRHVVDYGQANEGRSRDYEGKDEMARDQRTKEDDDVGVLVAEAIGLPAAAADIAASLRHVLHQDSVIEETNQDKTRRRGEGAVVGQASFGTPSDEPVELRQSSAAELEAVLPGQYKDETDIASMLEADMPLPKVDVKQSKKDKRKKKNGKTAPLDWTDEQLPSQEEGNKEPSQSSKMSVMERGNEDGEAATSASASKRSKKEKRRTTKSGFTGLVPESISNFIDSPLKIIAAAVGAGTDDSSSDQKQPEETNRSDLPSPTAEEVAPDALDKERSLESGHADSRRPENTNTTPLASLEELQAQSPAGSSTEEVERDAGEIGAALEAPAVDLDFAATLAAGLEDTGFDANIVLDDTTFHRRSSPASSALDPDDDEVYNARRTPRRRPAMGRPLSSTRGSETQLDSEPEQFETAEIPPEYEDFVATLAAGLQDTGFDPNIVLQNPTSREEESPTAASDHNSGVFAAYPRARRRMSQVSYSSSRDQANDLMYMEDPILGPQGYQERGIVELATTPVQDRLAGLHEEQHIVNVPDTPMNKPTVGMPGYFSFTNDSATRRSKTKEGYTAPPIKVDHGEGLGSVTEPIMGPHGLQEREVTTLPPTPAEEVGAPTYGMDSGTEENKYGEVDELSDTETSQPFLASKTKRSVKEEQATETPGELLENTRDDNRNPSDTSTIDDRHRQERDIKLAADLPSQDVVSASHGPGNQALAPDGSNEHATIDEGAPSSQMAADRKDAVTGESVFKMTPKPQVSAQATNMSSEPQTPPSKLASIFPSLERVKRKVLSVVSGEDTTTSTGKEVERQDVEPGQNSSPVQKGEKGSAMPTSNSLEELAEEDSVRTATSDILLEKTKAKGSNPADVAVVAAATMRASVSAEKPKSKKATQQGKKSKKQRRAAQFTQLEEAEQNSDGPQASSYDLGGPLQTESATSTAPDNAIEESEEMKTAPVPASTFSRDSAVHVSDSPLLDQAKPPREVVRDSGYHDPTVSPAGRQRQYQELGQTQGDEPYTGITDTSNSSADPLRISVEFDPTYNVSVSRQGPGPRVATRFNDYGQSIYDQWPAQLSTTAAEDVADLPEPPLTPAMSVEDLGAPSPIESTTKDRTSYLFQSSPSTREPQDNSASEQFTGNAEAQAPSGAPARSDDYFSHGGGLSGSLPPEPHFTHSAVDTSLWPVQDQLSDVAPPTSLSSMPLDSILEHSPIESPTKRSRSIREVASPELSDRGLKAARRVRSPYQSFRNRVEAGSAAGSRSPHFGNEAKSSGPPADQYRSDTNPSVEEAQQGTDISRNRETPRLRRSEQRSVSSQSARSTGAINPFIMTEPSRPLSGHSNRSGTPPLRRVSRNVSGDLRAASKLQEATGTHSADYGSDPHSISTTSNISNDKAKHLAKDMVNVYDGWGDARGSPLSPTTERPPSVRERQSVHVIELQSRVDQLASENRLLQDAKTQAERNASEANYQCEVDAEALAEAGRIVEARDRQLRVKDEEIAGVKENLITLQQELARLKEVNEGLTTANKYLSADTDERYASLQRESATAHRQWQQSATELQTLKAQHGQVVGGMEDIVRQEIAVALEDKNLELERLRRELGDARGQIRSLQQRILASKTKDDFLVTRDEDYFDSACQQLCQHVKQWIVRFSKLSDQRMCRLVSEINDEKIEGRLEDAILDGSDVDTYLTDRVQRRDVFMSMAMKMIWEYVFTRYLFGMDRDQRHTLKMLEKKLSEVGPPRAVAHWRATTLTLLSRRPQFLAQRAQDTEAVAQEIYTTLSTLLPPPPALSGQIMDSLRNVIKLAVTLSIEMRTQRPEYIMLPPLQPEYDPETGMLTRKVFFNASLMNDRSEDASVTTNEDLERRGAVVRMVLFPLVVKKGDDLGEGDEEIVVAPAQVLIATPTKDRKVVRVMSGALEIERPRSVATEMSGVESGMI